ncbi:SRPBCC domain-containing protein [Kitasatospora sp. NPDC059646]|uniref:SRPBCC domain-containing protein n=1 Tax=Kitasatospora sp. NPDC059646 TaxID=3346893 RepID=UPI00367B4A6D
MAEIALQIDVAASRARLLAALDTQVGLTSWWSTGIERDGDDLLVTVPDAPQPLRLRRERADQDRVAWRSVGVYPPSWQGTTVTWDLFDHPDGPRHTLLLLRHLGWAADAAASVPAAAGGWAEAIVRLKDYAQSGRPQPLHVPTGHPHPGVHAAAD